jgi:hypothetical protein
MFEVQTHILLNIVLSSVFAVCTDAPSKARLTPKNWDVEHSWRSWAFALFEVVNFAWCFIYITHSSHIMNFRVFLYVLLEVVTPGNSRGCVLNKVRFFITLDTFMQISMEICIQVPLFFFELMNNTELEIAWCKTCSEFASLLQYNEYVAKRCVEITYASSTLTFNRRL